MTDPDELPEDPFMSIIYDEPSVAVIQHDGHPVGTYYELDLVGESWALEQITAALATVPAGGRVTLTRLRTGDGIDSEPID